MYKRYNLILAKVLQKCKFVNSRHHRGRSPCNFLNYSEFLENFGTGSGYRAFRLCTKNFATCFDFYSFNDRVPSLFKKFIQELILFAKRSEM